MPIRHASAGSPKLSTAGRTYPSFVLTHGTTGFQPSGSDGSVLFSRRTKCLSGTGRLENVSVSCAGVPNTGPPTEEISGAPVSGKTLFGWTPTVPQAQGSSGFAASPKLSLVC